VARVEFTKNSLSPGIKNLIPVLNRNVYQVLRFHQPKVVAHAKTNAPWEDRTSNARNGLNAQVDVIAPHVYALTLYGSVPYQIWLEVRFAGKYAIIMPTIRIYGPLVMASFTKLLERMDILGGADK
jgi:hypothetical protein